MNQSLKQFTIVNALMLMPQMQIYIEGYASLREITQHLKKAIQYMQKDSFTKEQQDKIQQIKSLLAQPTIDKVVEVIEVLEDLLFQE